MFGGIFLLFIIVLVWWSGLLYKLIPNAPDMFYTMVFLMGTSLAIIDIVKNIGMMRQDRIKKGLGRKSTPHMNLKNIVDQKQPDSGDHLA